MAVKAVAKGVRMSPRKVAVVAALVRGRTVEDALVILSHTPRRSAIAVQKVIKSAKANADHNHNYKPATLRITEIGVTPGPRLKRYRPAAYGRALPFERKTSHIRVVVDGEIREVKKPAAKKAAEATEAVKTEPTNAAEAEKETK
jgi:large subunit ribosomal protein L22